MGLDLSPASQQVLVAFGCYLIGVLLLGIVSHRFLTRGSFVKEYFLGNRGLGAWVLALTVAATAISGGTFMGFPSLIYTNGWIMALWICSYMVVPITTMALLGKRINQVARISGAVTVPDVFRDRFRSPALGLTASGLILLFLAFNLVAQFKAGGLVIDAALDLPPARAEFLHAEVDAGKNLVLHFRLADGGTDRQRTPLPDEQARYLPAKTTVTESQSVQEHFQVREQEMTKQVKFPSQKMQLLGGPKEKGYVIGLLLFALTVVGYTTYGGFWAVTWTDVLEGLVMLIGVVLMAFLAVRAVEPREGPDGTQYQGLAAATEHLRHQDPALVYGPGPKNYLPVGMAISFFLMWSLMSAGQPSGMVRMMSFKDTPSLRRALMLVGGYYMLTYLCLLVIFVCARSIFPTEYLREIGTEGQPDKIMPAMTRQIAHPLVAGMLLAAPYAAIMSTVAAFLLMMSSSLVRDIYQRSINPDVSEKTIKRLSYGVTGLTGLVVMIGALNPPDYLQYLIVFTGSGQGCAFLAPMAITLYWPRATRQGVLAGMLGGFAVLFGLYVLGWLGVGGPRSSDFLPLELGGVDPLVWGLLTSVALSIGVSLATRPDEEQVKKYFP
jgi:Na+/proline symporter